MTIAVIGGTGNLGAGLARRWALAGYEVVIGSRTADKADAAARDLTEALGPLGLQARISGASNLEAARAAPEIVVLAVPFSSHAATLTEIRDALPGKVLVDTTVPLVPPAVARVQLPPEGSASLIAQALLGEEVKVVSAFENVAAHHLQSGEPLEGDVLVCGNDKEARGAVVALADAIGLRGLHAGALANSAATEALTSLLIFINKTYKCHAGIMLTGVPGQG